MSGQDQSDGELLQLLRRDPQVVGVLYDRYALRRVRYLQQHGASEDVALDATHEMFARLIGRGRRLRPSSDETIWPWLAVSGRNILRDWQRRGAVEAKARRRLGLPSVTCQGAGHTLTIPYRRSHDRLLHLNVRHTHKGRIWVMCS